MNPRRSFVRKIVYLVAIALLLVPLFWISQPSTIGTKGTPGTPGGQLAQLRAEHGLSEVQLGEIDPTSETIKLATLGMRGVAANILWKKANDYKKKKDWTNLSATYIQLSKLEPHFIAVWRYQAWNLSYNVAVEFDDFRERYRWLIKGIDFLQRGIRYNNREPRLVHDVGWFIALKMGRADEAKLYRELFKKDDDFHGERPPGERRDNWLVGKEWFTKAEKLVDEGARLRGMAPLIFFADRPMCQIYYAETLEEDGVFGERAKQAWQDAQQEWARFGSRDLPVTDVDAIRLDDSDRLLQLIGEKTAELDALEPGLREKLVQQKRDILPEEELRALAVAPTDRTDEEHWAAGNAVEKLNVTVEEVARRITGPNSKKARELADEISLAQRKADYIGGERMTVNYDYWQLRVKLEQSDAILDARQLIHAGRSAYLRGDLPGAEEAYRVGLAEWREVIDDKDFPGLGIYAYIVHDLMDVIRQYNTVLEKRDESFPEDFILQDIIDMHFQIHPHPRPFNPSKASP